MTRSFLTVRTGATVTHVQCKAMAAMWMSCLIAAARQPEPASATLASRAEFTVSDLTGEVQATKPLEQEMLSTTSSGRPATKPLQDASSAASYPTCKSQSTKSVEAETMLATPSSGRPGSAGTPSHSDGLETDIEKRLSIVERAIRLQMALGASHLQQIEMDPAAFGVPSSARSSVRQLRRDRNKALHGVGEQPPRQRQSGRLSASPVGSSHASSTVDNLTGFTQATKPLKEEATHSTPSSATRGTVNIYKWRRR